VSLGARRSAAITLTALLLAAAPVSAQAARTLSDWQRDLGDREYAVRASAAEALGKMPPGDVVPAVTAALESPEPRVRANAAVVLGGFGPAAMTAVPALARVLKDPNPRVRELAGEALARITLVGQARAGGLPLRCH